MIHNFLAEEKKDTIERVSKVFSEFNNETITLSNKEYRLPLFSSIEKKTFSDSTPFILARAKKQYWLVSICTDEIKDIDIMEFSEKCKKQKTKIHRKILIAPSGIEINARLMSKEENIWIWDQVTLNQLMCLYKNEKIISCVHHKKRIRLT